MSQEINIIDYRNARFQGFQNDSVHHGLNAILNEDFSFFLSHWKNGTVDGPSFLIFPNEKIFYGFFKNDKADGLCCYDMGEECQIYAQFDRDGFLTGSLAAVFPLMDLVLSIAKYSEKEVKNLDEYYYNNQKEKWTIIEDILKIRIQLDMKSKENFLQEHFIRKHRKILERMKRNDYFVRFSGQGVGFRMNLDGKLISIGYFDETNAFQGIGKKYIYGNNKKIIQEGVYKNSEKIVQYTVNEKRPTIIKQDIRNFFLESFYFTNKFLVVRQFEEIQNLFKILNLNIRQSKTEKLAQELLENPKQFYIERPVQKKVENKQQDILINKIREEIELSKEKNRSSRKSPTNKNTEHFHESFGRKIRSSPTNKNRHNPEDFLKEEQNKYEEKKRTIFAGSQKNSSQFPSRIYAKLDKRYELKTKKKSSSPIDELDLNRSGSSKNRNRLEKSWEKMNELTKMLQNLPKRDRQSRHHHRKYNYKEPAEDYSYQTPKPKRKEYINDDTPDRSKYFYFPKT